MAGGIHDVDFHTLIGDRRVLGKDGDAAFALDGVGVHDPLHNLLIGAEYAALL